mmetsp:Transcript_11418/g.10076  ORF Transcript_11418/g.10076 Transcript_11418/m.10076 type:complete len:173 (+) Transcript_11418:1012-1530(+)|eukprot:CAMPEP_0205804874 /NCGR_PEP_ID=MMETSP0205-20121125/7925_1 /ASSEMBLY_ACC=CAM_ASM_000278 /TAXON_ID=36767 /ORGANISM="Euplotes focardii, Strain TN1" /LENGTH=172 /DNA_ID=CAMNT_0053075183 /DNA_START=916 /DNA_END=1434 /DNA_ORIENTATION=+
MAMDHIKTSNFGAIELFNELKSKIENLISNQRQVDLNNKYDEYTNAEVVLEKLQEKMEFKIKIEELEKCKLERKKIYSNDKKNYIAIVQIEHNENAFDIYFGINNQKGSPNKIMLKMVFEPFTDSSIVMGSSDEILNKGDKEIKAAKILILNSESLRSDQELVINIELEEIQ